MNIQSTHTHSYAHTAFFWMGTGACFPGLKWPSLETDHIPSFNDMVMSKWKLTTWHSSHAYGQLYHCYRIWCQKIVFHFNCVFTVVKRLKLFWGTHLPHVQVWEIVLTFWNCKYTVELNQNFLSLAQTLMMMIHTRQKCIYLTVNLLAPE